ncbi:glycosyl transferase [Bacteroides gallinaceum]|nr:glycosyl transferase [Bacteroides gallinaceum]OUO49765.1 hypothetical protein B5F78_14625 [Bacteroides sp. An279]
MINNMIPKTIHYCWFGRNQKPENVLQCIQTWKDKMPDYEIKEWNEDNFDVNYNDFTKEAYHVKKYAFVSDVARLYALVKEGGIYLDTDIEVIKPFDNLLDKDYFIGYECFGKIGTGVIGAKANVHFIRDFLDTYNDKTFFNADGSYNESPNTILLSRFIQKNNIQLNIHDVDFFCAKNYQTGEIEQTDRTYCIHHFSGSWKPWYSRLEMKICKALGIRYRDFLFRHISK